LADDRSIEDAQDCFYDILRIDQTMQLSHEIMTMTVRNIHEIKLLSSSVKLDNQVDDSFTHNCPECKGPMQPIMKNCPSCGLRVKEEDNVLYPDIELTKNSIFGSVTEVWIYEIGNSTRRALATFRVSEYTSDNPDTVLYLDKKLCDEAKSSK